MPWDVMGGVARRAWARSKNSISTVIEYNKMCKGKDHITLPYLVEEEVIDEIIENLNFYKLL